MLWLPLSTLCILSKAVCARNQTFKKYLTAKIRLPDPG